MARVTTLTLPLLLATALPASAAQAPRRMPAMGRPAVAPATAQPATPPAPAVVLQAAPSPQCVVQRQLMQQQQQRLETVLAEAAGVRTEIETLKQRLQLLEARQGQLAVDAQTMQQQSGTAVALFQQQCPGQETCADFATTTAQLRTESAPLDEQMNALRKQMTESQGSIARLDHQVSSLRHEYVQRTCNDLKPGQTSQADIDRCAQIFSDWNRTQMAINQENSNLPLLRSHYEQVAMQQANVTRRAQELRQRMTTACSSNTAQLNELTRFSEVQQRAAAMQQQLDALTQAASRLAQVRITVGP
jgi:chromosome segregation ATPase